MTAYERFLTRSDDAASDERVLPYVGGTYADGLRIDGEPPAQHGFWRFAVHGRRCRVIERADGPALGHLPLVRGHLCGEYVVTDGAHAERLAWLPDEAPVRFAPVRCRRWSPCLLVVDEVEWETEAEEQARRCYEERRSIAAVSGLPATLRAAWAFAVAERYGRDHGLRVIPAEVRPIVARVIEAGEEGLTAHLARIREDRARAQEEHRIALESARLIDAEFAADRANWRGADTVARRGGRHRGAPTGMGGRGRPADPLEAAERALDQAGAEMLDARLAEPGMVEVRFRFLGERFVSMAEARTLQVIDAGICLAGADREITLDSLPSVIREAMRSGALVITRDG